MDPKQPDSGDDDGAWDDVIERRVAEVLDGTAMLVDGPASHAQVRAELAARRSERGHSAR
jgi:hypothetical protein